MFAICTELYNDLFVLDTESLEWSKPETVGTRPPERANFGMTNIENFILVYGGYGCSEYWFYEGAYCGDFYALNLFDMSWGIQSTENGLSPSPRASINMVQANGIVYIYGGIGSTGILGLVFIN